MTASLVNLSKQTSKMQLFKIYFPPFLHPVQPPTPTTFSPTPADQGVGQGHLSEQPTVEQTGQNHTVGSGVRLVAFHSITLTGRTVSIDHLKGSHSSIFKMTRIINKHFQCFKLINI